MTPTWRARDCHHEDRWMADAQRVRTLCDCQPVGHCGRDAELQQSEKLNETQENKQEEQNGHIIGHSTNPTQNETHLRSVN